MPPAHIDIAIAGAGPTGIALALGLQNSGYAVALFDTGKAENGLNDPRALALSHGTRQLLQRYAAWPESECTLINDIHISQQGFAGLTRLHAAELGIPALGYVVRYGALLQKLRQCAATQGLLPHYECSPTQSRQQNARLLVHAEGCLDEAAYTQLDYRQTAIVCEASPTQAHANMAWERFTPDGPLALLPLGQAYAVVLTTSSTQSDKLLTLNDTAFAEELSRRLGGRLRFNSITPRTGFPLKLRLRKSQAEGNEVWLGNAAQTLHPVSGQGFNLALRDAFTLAKTLKEQPLSAHNLQRWAKKRQIDRLGTTLFTDGIVRLFSNKAHLLQLSSNIGLGALNALPIAKNFIARRMIWGIRTEGH